VGCEKGVSDHGVASGGDLCGECSNLCVWEGVEGDDGKGKVVGEVGVEAGDDEEVNLGGYFIFYWIVIDLLSDVLMHSLSLAPILLRILCNVQCLGEINSY